MLANVTSRLSIFVKRSALFVVKAVKVADTVSFPAPPITDVAEVNLLESKVMSSILPAKVDASILEIPVWSMGSEPLL